MSKEKRYSLFELILCANLIGLESFFWMSSKAAPTPLFFFLFYSFPNLVVFVLLVLKRPKLNIVACFLVGCALSVALERYINFVFVQSEPTGTNIVFGWVVLGWIPCITVCLTMTYALCNLFHGLGR